VSGSCGSLAPRPALYVRAPTSPDTTGIGIGRPPWRRRARWNVAGHLVAARVLTRRAAVGTAVAVLCLLAAAAVVGFGLYVVVS